MTEPIFELRDVVVTVNQGTPEEINIMDHVNFAIYPGDFITILGSNGAGKSTLFNVVGGNIHVTSGQILLHGKDITNMSVERRTHFLSRVFQDPKMGTAPRMTVAENLLLSMKRGQRRGFGPRHLKQNMGKFKEITAVMNNGLEERLNTATGKLSGGQRQALSFLMATIKRPEILLLDEHTAALDPQTSQELMNATNDQITRNHLTCLMITHHLDDALKYGNRLIVLDNGKITYDIAGDEKDNLTKEELLSFFNEIEE
ncbi:ATP-binding cassette domain-containing protein [Lentilactobacillus parafarraginis]|jgi:putative ABC transport system ATP-binding protein|uniref:ABC transporter, ATP-binding protein n=3 Tax=Lentilactobacillus parafarraginis TaxID=390842 RepID=A0A0R1YZV3_9LACO|nr:ATP-binding cassette domain-containing protein [Lentilactobacillus parafarraginis]EHM00182.1 ABC transporter, ATP-binding protein [Lentilactobacillus parafarraginis F0439]KRM45062.1 ABC transporter, ATP-binding protein [Lentilactobacillus parafarraginis DSM 18390 = JCM 14109]TLQ17454.1 ATP-binding cassette domain-containing protein [Lentilactobacillus parafarraginis]